MNGYLMKEAEWVPGEDLFIECFAMENDFGVVFEDDGDTAYFYAVEKDAAGGELRILDALHIHDSEDEAAPAQLKIIWSRDWLKCALILDGHIHALFDFDQQGGYNVNEFPPPNAFWTKGERQLTDEIVRKHF